MKIIYDHQTFILQSYGGISRYFVRLARGLMELGQEIDVVAPIYRNRYLQDLPKSLVHGIKFGWLPPKTSRLALLANHHLSKFKLSNLPADILHETYYGARPTPANVKCRVITVFDMIHEKFPSNFSFMGRVSKNKRLAVNRADHIICISESTKNDLCSTFDVREDRVTVIHLGFEKLNPQFSDLKKPIGAMRPFLLYVGSRRGYKNFERMLKAVSSSFALKNSFEVIAFGGGGFNREEQEMISRLGLSTKSVRQVGGGDGLLGHLYARASALVYPSVYEGFGLPPLEAMAHDCPVVTSNTSSMPEVVGDAGMYFDPMDIEAQAHAIESVVFDDHRRSHLIAAGRQRLALFSWDRCARETQAVYQKVLTSRETT